MLLAGCTLILKTLDDYSGGLKLGQSAKSKAVHIGTSSEDISIPMHLEVESSGDGGKVVIDGSNKSLPYTFMGLASRQIVSDRYSVACTSSAHLDDIIVSIGNACCLLLR
jgi:hypothetical protein